MFTVSSKSVYKSWFLFALKFKFQIKLNCTTREYIVTKCYDEKKKKLEPVIENQH